MSARRSWLFVPGDSARKIERAFQSSADALILDWEDAVAPASKAAARAVSCAALAAASHTASHIPSDSADHPVSRCWVRINPLDSSWLDDDLAALPATSIAGVMLPKACGPADVERLGQLLEAVERRDGVAPGTLAIVPIVTETAASVLALQQFRGPVPRLAAMLWGAEDLAADMGIARNRDATGRYRAPFQLARNTTLIAAAAARCLAIDAVLVDFRDQAALADECAEARADGFSAKAAVHPDQLATIQQAFAPTAEERGWAERVLVALQDTSLGVVDGKMVDVPHLRLAQRILST